MANPSDNLRHLQKLVITKYIPIYLLIKIYIHLVYV